MSTFTKAKLSGSTDGLPIKIAATAIGSADTIHTSVSGTTAGVFDEIWIYAQNSSSSAVKLTVCWGGVTDVDHTIEYNVAAEDGLKCIVPGLILQNAKVVKAFAGTTNVLTILGFVNKIS
jgi:hypothetical protein